MITEHLFAAGTLIIPLAEGTPLRDDVDWQPLSQDSIVLICQRASFSEDSVASNLDGDVTWLVKHNFIRLTWMASMGCVFIRVYIIPEDSGDYPKPDLYARHEKLAVGTKLLRALLASVSRSSDAWNARPGASPEPSFFDAKSTQGLQAVYQDLPSPPSVDPTHYPLLSSPHTSRPCPTVFKPRLHAYQERSLARMLHLENLTTNSSNSQPTCPSPLFVAIESLGERNDSNGTFYIDPVRLVVRKAPPQYRPVRGGILCEEMGTGKTVISTALILSTLDALSSPPDNTPIVTEFSCTQDKSDGEAVVQIPSLVDLACHVARVSRSTAHFDRYQSSLPDQVWTKLTATTFCPFYESLPVQPPTKDARTRSTTQKLGPPTRTFLTHATLLLVPKMLLPQWRSELKKHVHADGLKILVIEELTKLIVLTHERLTLESMRARRSKASKHAAFTLSQIRWLRLIIDEGNICAYESDRMLQARAFSAERKWIVTGTPTTNLVNTDSSEAVFGHQEDLLDVYSDDEVDDTETVDQKMDRQDLRKLSTMITGFLGLKMSSLVGGFHETRCGASIAAEEKEFNHYIIAPMCNGSGGWQADIVLKQLLSDLMVRHRIKDVENEIALPPLSHQIIHLTMDPFQTITYNILQSFVAINAVDSERTDRDYFFHPDNKGPLAELLRNLSQSCFWHAHQTALGGPQLDASVRRAAKSIDTAVERGVGQKDLELVKKAYQIQYDAAHNKRWRAMMCAGTVPMRVYGLPQSLQRAWDFIPGHYSTDPLYPTSTPFALISPPALSPPILSVVLTPLPPSDSESLHYMVHVPQLRQAGSECQLFEESMVRHGLLFRQAVHGVEEEIKTTKVEGQDPSTTTTKDKSPSKKSKKKAKPGDNSVGLTGTGAAPSPKALSSLGTGALSQSSSGDILPWVSKSEYQQQYGGVVLGSTPPDHPLLKAWIGNSCSPKINFVISEMLYHPNDRFIIFSDSFISLAYLKDALDIAMIPSLVILTANQNKGHGPDTIHAFETTGVTEYQALLMELKNGARGLNLTSANRVIFLEPVWRPDVESQAIKRAHRIGQQRPVTVYTLVMKQTPEEEMIAQRMKHGKLQKLMQNDGVMREFISNPKFIDVPQEEPQVTISFPLFTREEMGTPRAGSKHPRDLDIVEPSGDISNTSEGHVMKKAKRVAFAV